MGGLLFLCLFRFPNHVILRLNVDMFRTNERKDGGYEIFTEVRLPLCY